MNKRFHLLFFLIALISLTSGVSAQTHNTAMHKQWAQEMRQLRSNYVSKELNLTDDQRSRFIPLYDQMSRELMKVMSETRSLYKSVKKKGDEATNLEKEKAAEALFECKGKENAIEMRYFQKFKEILTPDQLMKLKDVEHKFNRKLIKEREKGKKK